MAAAPQLTGLLGSRLRPAARGRDDRDAELLFGAHAADGALLGWVAIGPGGDWPPLGGLTVATGATLRDACRLARAGARQLAAFGSTRSAHHSVLTAPGRSAEFLQALRPLVDAAACTIAYTSEDGAILPSVAAECLARSAAAATVAALGPDAEGATVAIARETPAALAAAAAATAHGARLVEPRALAADCDLLLVDRPLRDLAYADALAIRARTVVCLHATWAGAAAERVLRDRGVLLVPDTLAAAGPVLAAELRDRGTPEAALPDAVSAAVAEQARALAAGARPLAAPRL